MILGRIKGNVVGTVEQPCYGDKKIMIVQPIDETGEDIGDSFLACDTVHAGPGDTVLVQREGNTARQLLGTSLDPFHSVIVGIVDKVSVEIKE